MVVVQKIVKVGYASLLLCYFLAPSKEGKYEIL